MNSKTILFSLLFIAACCRPGYGQEDWSLKSDKDGIAVFTRSFPDSKFKAVKVECTLAASLSQLVAVILDVNTGDQWVYSTKSAYLLRQISASELIYYSEISVPWPASNRDFIAHLSVVQDARTKVVTVYGPTLPDYVPVKKDVVRIVQSEGRWVITPLGPNRIKVEYTLRVDPGGNIPAWLVNMFAAKGPTESFRKLKTHIRKSGYQNIHLPFITD
ncbi:MAG TPA: START domain-containing protein [Chitinophagaceae bacterium]|nr:START domain-containing protein [Chitinophagaceae bacterium]